MFQSIDDIFSSWLEFTGFSTQGIFWFKSFIYLVFVLIVALISDRIARYILQKSLKLFIIKSKSSWDDILYKKGVFKKLVHLIPAVILYYSCTLIFQDYEGIVSVVRSAFYIYMIILSIFFVDSIINALHEIYNQYPFAKSRPIKGYIQVVKIFLYFVGAILILSVILNKPAIYFLSGLGAIAAVLLLVFKDTILGFVASIQLSANKMLKIGDWIEMPSHNADGTVTEISLNTVKVQNWNKTISTIPTYALVSESFNNWRGMEESGGRRIKRSINIDMKSIKFLDKQLIEKFKKIHILKDYIEGKEIELEAYNAQNNIDPSVMINGRRLTNIGTFRKYVELYLRNNESIKKNMTFLVRQLQPSERGLPIEIYVFSKDQEWASYEDIQADIFDHILAAIGEFQLRLFQNPSGYDFQNLINN